MIVCDVQRCVGCRMCEVTCSVSHFDAVSPALSRIRVSKREATGIDLAVSCISCAEKPCLVCPTDALEVGPQGQIVLVADLCSACENCVEACPIGAIGYHEVPLFCDLCDGEIACVSSCPADALSCVDEVGASLLAFSEAQGGAAERRATYAEAAGAPLRARWKAGLRVDG